jgi:transcriptional regulator with XRE-family HTH domain
MITMAEKRSRGLELPRLRYWRERRALTQSELADLAGVTRVTITHIESGQPAAMPSVRKLAAALNVSLDQLTGMRDED